MSHYEQCCASVRGYAGDLRRAIKSKRLREDRAEILIESYLEQPAFSGYSKRTLLAVGLAVALTGCAGTGTKANWHAYALEQCAVLTGEAHERCVVDVVGRCASSYDVAGPFQAACSPAQ